MKRLVTSTCRGCGLALFHADGYRYLCSRCSHPTRPGVVSRFLGGWWFAEHVDDVMSAVVEARESGATLVSVRYDESEAA
jgi:hypothetical protein